MLYKDEKLWAWNLFLPAFLIAYGVFMTLWLLVGLREATALVLGIASEQS